MAADNSEQVVFSRVGITSPEPQPVPARLLALRTDAVGGHRAEVIWRQWHEIFNRHERPGPPRAKVFCRSCRSRRRPVGLVREYNGLLVLGVKDHNGEFTLFRAVAVADPSRNNGVHRDRGSVWAAMGEAARLASEPPDTAVCPSHPEGDGPVQMRHVHHRLTRARGTKPTRIEI